MTVQSQSKQGERFKHVPRSATKPLTPQLRLWQCPGCWSYGTWSGPGPNAYLECECGEGLQLVDLRGPAKQGEGRA